MQQKHIQMWTITSLTWKELEKKFDTNNETQQLQKQINQTKQENEIELTGSRLGLNPSRAWL